MTDQVPDPMRGMRGSGGDISNGGSPKKKSVSWSDSADLALKLRLSGHFMDLLWLHIAKHLLQFLHELNWRRQEEEEKVRIADHYITGGSVIVLKWEDFNISFNM